MGVSLTSKLDRIVEENKGSIPSMDRRSGLSLAEFDATYREKRPVILTDACNDWPARKKWTFDFFRHNYKDVAVPANIYTAAANNTTIGALIDRILAHGRNSNVGSEAPYLQDWRFGRVLPGLLEDFEIPKYFADDWLRKNIDAFWGKLWLGADGAQTGFHRDRSFVSVWQAQLVGRKQWYLFPPSCEEGNPSVEAGAMQGLLEPGALIYFPCGWWHRVDTLEASICLSANFLEEKNLCDFTREICLLYMIGWLGQERLQKADQVAWQGYAFQARGRAIDSGINPDDILGQLPTERMPADNPERAMAAILDRWKRKSRIAAAN